MLNWEGVTDTGEDRGLAEKERGGGQTWAGNQWGWCPGRHRAQAPILGAARGRQHRGGEGRWRGEVARQRGGRVERK